MKPVPQQVWDATIANPKFAVEMPEGSSRRTAIRPFIEGSVGALDDMLGNTVTLQSIADAKVKFIHYCIDNNLGHVMGEELGVGGDFVNGMLQSLIEAFEPVVKNMAAFLEENGVTEEDLMTSPKIGMNEANQQKWRDGTLTIGELLATQLGVILENQG
jgi:hypothetical protein